MKKKVYQTIIIVVCLMGISGAVCGQDVEVNKLKERISQLEQMVLTLTETNMNLTQEIAALKASDSKNNLNSSLSSTTDVDALRRFYTPETTIEYFIECINNKDYGYALNACAVEKVASGYNHEA